GFDPYNMVMSAVAFLMLHGPITQQERWEEASGFSPSTLAANIAALTCAASFARELGDELSADLIQDYADYLKCHLEHWTVTPRGAVLRGVREYFVRINPVKDVNAVDNLDIAELFINTRAASKQQIFQARNIVDGGFLELVRYGVYPADS